MRLPSSNTNESASNMDASLREFRNSVIFNRNGPKIVPPAPISSAYLESIEDLGSIREQAGDVELESDRPLMNAKFPSIGYQGLQLNVALEKSEDLSHTAWVHPTHKNDRFPSMNRLPFDQTQDTIPLSKNMGDLKNTNFRSVKKQNFGISSNGLEPGDRNRLASPKDSPEGEMNFPSNPHY